MTEAHLHPTPVLVRSGLRLDDCVTEMCIAVKVKKQNASEALKMVQCAVIVFAWQSTISVRSRHSRPGAVALPSSVRPHPTLQKGALMRRRARAAAAGTCAFGAR
jgi:hypothetical protein